MLFYTSSLVTAVATTVAMLQLQTIMDTRSLSFVAAPLALFRIAVNTFRLTNVRSELRDENIYPIGRI